jgi:hypothetical protein
MTDDATECVRVRLAAPRDAITVVSQEAPLSRVVGATATRDV